MVGLGRLNAMRKKRKKKKRRTKKKKKKEKKRSLDAGCWGGMSVSCPGVSLHAGSGVREVT